MRVACLLALAGLVAQLAWHPAATAASPRWATVVMDSHGQLLLAPIPSSVSVPSKESVITRKGEMYPFIDEAIDLLRIELNQSREEISLWRVERTTFRDGSLGKPEPGRMYTQALVEGYVLVLRTGDRFYQYHTDGNRIVTIGEVQKYRDRNLPGISR